MAEADESGFSIPDFLKFTKDDIAKYHDDQAKLRAKYGIDATHGRKTQAEQNIAYHERQVILSLQNIETLVMEGTLEQAEHEANRLATSYTYLGDYQTARDYCRDPELMKWIDSIETAVGRPDDETCNCQPVLHKHEKGNLSIGHSFVFDHVVSPKHGRIMPVIKCGKCGDLQVGGTAPIRPDDSRYRHPDIAQKVAVLPRRR